MAEHAWDGVASPGTSDETTPTRLQGGWLKTARIAWLVLAITAVLILVASLPGYAVKFGGQLSHGSNAEAPPGATFFAAASGVASLVSVLISIGLSGLLFRRKFTEPIAAFLSFFLLIYGVVMSGPLELAGSFWIWEDDSVGFVLQGILIATPIITLLMLMPNGKFVPDWTRWVVFLSIPWNFGLFLIAPFDAASISRRPVVAAVVSILLLAFFLAGFYAQIHRYRKISNRIERQQTRWVIYGIVLWLGYILLTVFPYLSLTGISAGQAVPWWAPASELGWWLSLNILPICLTIAITRYRLWDIDLVVNRTLVYGTLVFGILALYALVVGGIGLLFQPGDNLLLPLLATSLAAILFHPMQQRLQRAVNRLMFGDRDDPAAVLNKLGELLEKTGSAEATLARIVETVARALKLTYAGIKFEDQGILVASYGKPVETPYRLPLVYQGETVGSMLVGGRTSEEVLTPKDIRLLEEIARHTGVVAHNVRLTADLQRSRSRLVTAREEERRRIRRDLHDGLGPQLASQSLTLEAIEKLLDRDPEKVRNLLAGLKVRSQEAITDIRRLIYDLRPPALDDLGLVAALEQETARYSGTRLRIEFHAPKSFPQVPAAVELAAFRIVQEAVNNAVKHAGAKICSVNLEIAKGNLLLSISDDGIGLPKDHHSGVGFQTMRERSIELGGKLDIKNGASGGVCVTAVLPLASD